MRFPGRSASDINQYRHSALRTGDGGIEWSFVFSYSKVPRLDFDDRQISFMLGPAIWRVRRQHPLNDVPQLTRVQERCSKATTEATSP